MGMQENRSGNDEILLVNLINITPNLIGL